MDQHLFAEDLVHVRRTTPVATIKERTFRVFLDRFRTTEAIIETSPAN